MAGTGSDTLSVPCLPLALPPLDVILHRQRDRSASIAWVEFLTAPSENPSPYASDSEGEEGENDPGQLGGSHNHHPHHKPPITGKKTPRIDDSIFDKFSEGSNKILIGKFLAMLEGSIETLQLTREEFRELIFPNIFIISNAFRNHLIIPKFDQFCQVVEDIYNECREIRNGQVAKYLARLENVDPERWGVSFCTVDGQRYSIGDTGAPVTFHSLSKPLMYAYALQEIGKKTVHKYVGQEPSGHNFNELVLDHKKRPHNPMINAGGIMIHALLQRYFHPEFSSAQRFDATHGLFEKMSGGEYIGFSNGMFLSKRKASDRNWALGHFMKEHQCFPGGSDLNDVIEYYLQTSSMETTVEVMSVIASTLANGGICPITSQRVLSEEVVADVLSVMFSCGMLEFSGKFGFRVGLPAKSSIAGIILLVIPNIGGFALWSPALDKGNNSVRGVAFCEKLVETFNFHCFDVDKSDKIDPTRGPVETKGSNSIALMFSAAAGDIDSIFRLHLSGVDMNLGDVDNRTALHIAACEGHYEVCHYLLRQCGVKHDRKDRWGNTPYDEAITFEHSEIAELLMNWHSSKRKRYDTNASRSETPPPPPHNQVPLIDVKIPSSNDEDHDESEEEE